MTINHGLFSIGGPVFLISLRNGHHVRRYSISRVQESGWEVTREQDPERTHHVCYRDWHRVEHACAVFALEVSALTEQGWQLIREQ
jgi:hypothetical protein